ncbi:MAG: methyltransferase [Methanobrevibacter sp.]|jgi:tRNA (guanine37-N1)-methyltransferase|nr:methyltransferase [Methanobrevibacter sp.]
MLVVKVPLNGINALKNILMEKNLVERNYKLQTKDGYGFIPVVKLENLNEIKQEMKKSLNYSQELNSRIIKEIKVIDLDGKNLNLNDSNFKDLSFKSYKKSPSSVVDTLKEDLDGIICSNELDKIKKSFDIIGEIVILEIPDGFLKYKNEIAIATLKFTKRKSVFMKKGAVSGVIRTRDLEFLCGENNPETIYKEHGIKLKLNVKTVYFSPRLGSERLRVSNQVTNNEKILDMFTGIGPFPILIAKNHDVNITAVDINKEAIKYLKENINLNKLKGKIYPKESDICEIAKKYNNENTKFNRIIMNLPGSAFKFLDLSFSLIEDEGIIHYYEFGKNYEEGKKRLQNRAIKFNKEIEILSNRKVKSTSPGMWHLVFDVKIMDKT